MITPPDGEVFTVSFHGAMRDRFVAWLESNRWELLGPITEEGVDPVEPREYVAVLDGSWDLGLTRSPDGPQQTDDPSTTWERRDDGIEWRKS